MRRPFTILLAVLFALIAVNLGFADSKSSTAKKREKLDLGTRDFSNESLFTGDVAFSYPIATKGGVEVALRYNSNMQKVLPAVNKFSTSGWVGLGWSLALGSIQGDINNTRDTSDDRYYFVGPEFSSELIQISGNDFMMKEYKYWTITRHVTGGTIDGWTIVIEDGTTYRYGNYNKSTGSFDATNYTPTYATRSFIGCGNLVETNNFEYNPWNTSLIPYQWDLSDVQDVNGDHTTVRYQQTQGTLSNWCELSYTIDSYPQDITDRLGRKIEFVLYSSPLLYVEQGMVGYGQTKTDTRSLKQILQKDSLGTIISCVQFEYDSMNVFNRTSTLNKKLFLKKISEQDRNLQEVKRTDFDYAGVGMALCSTDYNPGGLTKITMPEGGTIEYTYERSQVVTDRSPELLTNGRVWSSYGSGRLANDMFFWSMSGTDFFVVNRNGYLQAYRWGESNRITLDGSFPFGSAYLSTPIPGAYWVQNDYVVTKNGTSLCVAKRRGEGWIWQIIESNITIGSTEMVGLGSDYFVYAVNCTHNGGSILPTGGDVKVATFKQDGSWIIQSLGTQGIGPGYNLLFGARFFTNPGGGSVWTWNPGTLQWVSTATSVYPNAAGQDYWISQISPTDVEIMRWNGSSWSGTHMSSGNFNASFVPANNYFVLYNGSGTARIATPVSNGWSANTRIDSLLPTARLDSRSRIAAGPDFVAATWYDPDTQLWNVGVVRFKNGQWVSDGVIGTIPNASQMIAYVTPSVSNSTLFVELFDLTTKLQVIAFTERDGVWSSQELTNQNLGWYNGYQNPLEPFMQAGWNFSVCVIDSNLKRYGVGTILGWKKTYGTDFREVYSDTAPGGYDYRVASKKITDGRGGVKITNFSYSNGAYDDDINNVRYGKTTTTPTGNNGSTDTYFYNHMPPGSGYQDVPDYQYLDGSPYLILTNRSGGGNPPEEVDNTWGVQLVGSQTFSQSLKPCETTISGRWITEPPYVSLYTVLDDGDVLDPYDYAYSQTEGDTALVRLQVPSGPLDPSGTTQVVADIRPHDQGIPSNYWIVLWEWTGQYWNYLGEVSGSTPATGDFLPHTITVSNYLISNPGQLYVGMEIANEFVDIGRINCTVQYRIEKGVSLTHLNQAVKKHDGVSLTQNYQYCGTNGLQSSLGETNSDGTVRYTTTKYAHERTSFSDMGGSKHMLSQVYTSSVYNGSDVYARKWTMWGNSDGVWRPREEWLWKGDGTPNDRTAPDDPDGGAEALKVASYDTYDGHGNLLQSTDANGVPTAIAMGYSSALPIGTFKNASAGQVVAAVFDDGSLSNWTGSAGTWSIGNGAYQQTDGTTTQPWFTPMTYAGVSLSDAVVEGDIRFDNAGNYRYAALAKVKDATHELLFELRKTENAAWIEVVTNGSATARATASFTYNENRWYHVKAELSGTQARLYVDGVLLCTLTDAGVNNGSGTIGLATFGTKASFDNIRYYPLGAVATMQSYDPVSFAQIQGVNENGNLTSSAYDSFNRRIRESARSGGMNRLVNEYRYNYSRSLDGTYSNGRPNAVETILVPDTSGSTDFSLPTGWTVSGNITFNVPYAGEPSTVRMGTTGGSWDNLYKYVPSGHVIARVDFYPDSTSAGGSPHPLAFEGSNYRFCVQYDGNQQLFRMQLCINGSWQYPMYFSLSAPFNRWYTVELEKTETGEAYAFVYPRGRGRIYASGYMYTTSGYPTNWAPYVISWSNFNYFYLANHYVGLPDRDVAYFDGYGRAIQDQKQLKTHTVVASSSTYDSLGRTFRVYKPYDIDFTGGSRHRYDSTFATHADSYYNSMDVSDSYTNGYPYSETSYAPDPLARPSMQSAPGTDFRMGTGHELKYFYLADGYNLLNLTRRYDEDSTIIETYQDKFGNTTLSVVDPPGLNLQTRFSYNVLGKLVQSVTPRGDTSKYTYNQLSRLAQKRTPDQGTVQYLYDKNNNLRLVKDSVHTGTSVGISPVSGSIHTGYSYSGQFTLGMPGRLTLTVSVQDLDLGNEYVSLRIKKNNTIVCQISSSGWNGASNAIVLPKGTYTWESQAYGSAGDFTYSATCSTCMEFVYYKYDVFNRVIEAGEYESSSASGDFTQSNAESATFPSSGCYVSSQYTYDTPASEPLAAGQRNLKGRASSALSYRAGLLALSTYYSYDELGNTEWVLQKNSAGKSWQLKYEHDLQGRITKRHFLDGTSSRYNLYTFYSYDQMGRLLSVSTDTLSTGATKVTEGTYTYYAGTTQRLQLASAQGVDYRYNSRDWLKQINHQNLNPTQDPGHDGPGYSGVQHTDVYGEVLGYNIPGHIGDPAYQNATPHWNGNISWMIYTMSGVAFNGTSLVGNTYNYDKAGRLTGSNFGYYTTSWLPTSAYDESGYTYDANGNIMHLSRRGYNGNIMDSLTYVYASGTNRLRHVNDAVSAGAFTTDIDNQQTDNYTYDDNGALQQDVQRDVAFAINDIHNLPISMWKISNGQELKYYYDTEGKRIRKDASTTEYYVNAPDGNTEAVVKSDESNATHNIWANDDIGQVKRSNTTWTRYYYLKDHLGTIKMTVDASANITGWDDYYPFGMIMDQRSSASGSDSRYKYTSKERDVESGYDHFGARYYDARLGRFVSVDPAEDILPGWGGYIYSFDSPTRFVDPTGMVPGEYMDEQGNKIGDDQKKDNKTYVTDKQTIDKNTTNGHTNWKAVKANPQTAELPNETVRQEMGKAVDRAGENAFHEEGGIIANTKAGQKVVNANPGTEADPVKRQDATINVFDAANKNEMKNVTGVAGTFHTHPDGTQRQGSTVYGFDQPPSSTDVSNARSDARQGLVKGNSYVLSRAQNTVYIYNKSGTVRTYPLDKFSK